MNNKNKSYIRILAIYPISEGFGFAVLEPSDKLIDWGVVHVPSSNTQECLVRVGKFIDRYRPDVVVTEHPIKSPHRGERVRLLLADILTLATRKRKRRGGISRRQVRTRFSKLGRITKRRIAITISKQFPELEPRLPRLRKPWMSQDSRMAIFDSLALALTWMDSS
jgi:hypothetical protein